MAQPVIPSEWNNCSWEQLNEIHRIISENSSNKLKRNLDLWLMLSGMEIVEGEGEILDKGEYLFYFRKKDSTLQHVDGKHDAEPEEELFSVRADDLALYLLGSHPDLSKISDKRRVFMQRHTCIPGILDWVDEIVGKNGTKGLTILPIDKITIGGIEWTLPSALITNVTYEQYTNAQNLHLAIGELTEEMQRRIKSIEGRSKVDNKDIEDIDEMSKEIMNYRARLVSHMLIPCKKGVEYKSEDAEENAKFFMDHMNEIPHLFNILIQHIQSCIGVYKTQFPDLFSGEGKGSDYIPMVNEVNTINAIMKWQGYQEQQKVFDSNAIFIFSILNSMTKEAKAIEEANAKMKNHRK